MRFCELNDKIIGIWGMGKEGVAAKKAVSSYACPRHIIEINESNLKDIESCNIIIKSPGVSLYREEILKARANGIVFTSGTNLFFANHDPAQKVIAVTGTKGKSTTSSLVYHTLKQLGQNVALGGNIGVPLLELMDKKAAIIVAELSSYQCADFSGRPDIAVLVNLFPEHLPWHKSHEQYYADKFNMVKQAHRPIINFNDPKTSQILQNYPDLKKTTRYFNLSPLTLEHFPLKGEHNLQNADAVLSVVSALGYDTEKAKMAFQSFVPLPHRLETVCTYEGRTFVDDSISTTPETAIAAMEAFKGKHITLIMGGQDRGQDYNALADYTRAHNVCVITLPDTGRRMDRLTFTYPADDMKEAVELAKRQTPAGGIILLSPAAPSYNMFKSFEERGDDFKNCIPEKNNERKVLKNIKKICKIKKSEYIK